MCSNELLKEDYGSDEECGCLSCCVQPDNACGVRRRGDKRERSNRCGDGRRKGRRGQRRSQRRHDKTMIV